MKRSARTALLVAVLAGAAGGAWLLAARRPTVRVDRGPVSERIVARAAVEPVDGTARVFAPVDGVVLRVLCREGDAVTEGQLLAELEPKEHPERITAPRRGVVLARRVEPGDRAVAAPHGAVAPLFEIADPARTELRVEVEEPDASRIAPGLSITATSAADPGARARGVVERVAARLTPRTLGADDARVRADGVVRSAVVTWSGQPPPWPIGARAEAVIDLGRKDVPARVPRAAVQVRDGRAVVDRRVALWTVETEVEIVAADDVYAGVRGIVPGSEVVVDAVGALR